MKNKENGYMGFWNFSRSKESDVNSEIDFVKQHENYRKRKYLEYEKKIYNQNFPNKLIRKIDNQEKSYKNYKNEFLIKQNNQRQEYQDYKNEVTQNNSLKLIRRTTSLLPIWWGFGVLSVSSVISTIFSIERNTRQIDPE